eukprot:CAMPEP_0116823266 /NCGR_PEP_ID=MMETSP0418-20121206/745_1 /TAXON_ID=1158023 /ORGANISM="Astrosyne radiata, Strain 13vi08-1A" /LENGTH=141 /DNA_ID=CAMNT_0004451505 /DNA_START=183 /DNA_END=608 /DNA_ORIENTATION=+
MGNENSSQRKKRGMHKGLSEKHVATEEELTIDKFIEKEAASNPVLVFSKSYCPFCDQTKRTFSDMKDINAKVHELDHMPNGVAVQDELYRMTGQRTVPNIFLQGKHFGGNDDLQKAVQTGTLEELLQKKEEAPEAPKEEAK